MAKTSDSTVLSRRRLVQGLAVAAGAAGLSVAGRSEASSTAEASIEAGRRLVVSGTGWRATVVGAVPGVMPELGAVPSTTGTLVVDGEQVGTFASASVPGSGGRFVLHSFDLGLGSLLGMGAGSLADGVFAVVGGTGRYAGAQGSYTAVQRPRNLGGDGTAEFVLDLTAWEG